MGEMLREIDIFFKWFVMAGYIFCMIAANYYGHKGNKEDQKISLLYGIVFLLLYIVGKL